MIYAIRAGNRDLFKIGLTSGSPEARCAQLQTGCPDRLAVYRTIRGHGEETERVLHGIVEHLRQRGEWFALSAEGVDRLFDYVEYRLEWSHLQPVDGHWYLIDHHGYPLCAAYDGRRDCFWTPFHEDPIGRPERHYPLVEAPPLGENWTDEAGPRWFDDMTKSINGRPAYAERPVRT